MRGKCESCEFWCDTGQLEHAVYIVGKDELQSLRIGGCHIRSVQEWPARREDDQCGEHKEREVAVTTEEHHCSCGAEVIIKVQGGQVVDWNGHGLCPGPVQILGGM